VQIHQSGTVPFCDWQMPWEYSGSDTQARFRETVGLDVDASALNGMLEVPPANAQLSLNGLNAGATPASSKSTHAPPQQALVTKPPGAQQPILFVYIGLIGLLLGLIWWHVFY